MRRTEDHYGSQKPSAAKQFDGLPLLSGAPSDALPVHQVQVVAHTRTLTGQAAIEAKEREAERDLDAKFAAFHSANPHVYAAIEAKCLAEQMHGASVISVKGIVEELRKLARTKAIGSEYAFDNSLTSRFAWLVLDRNPQLREQIKVKRSGVPPNAIP
jgi:hypothetical protein